MGQAKNRGGFEQRKAQAIENQKEHERLNDWLQSRQTARKMTRVSALTIAGCLLSSGVIPIYPKHEMWEPV